jgi:hypothetical protein
MTSNVLLFGWNRPLPGRETISSAHFNDFVQYLTGLQQSGGIGSFEIVFLDAHGGDLNGFFLLRGDAGQLDALQSSTDWIRHITRAAMHLDGVGAVRGATGDSVMARMEIWRSQIPE